MLRMLDRREYKGLFLIRNHPKIRAGVYTFGKGRFRSTTRGRISKAHGGFSKQRGAVMLLNIRMVKDLSKTNVNIKPTYWLKQSMQQAINQGTISRFFLRAAAKHLEYQMAHKT